MGAVTFRLVGALLAASGCCLATAPAGTADIGSGTAAGSSTGAPTTGGASTTGGSTTGGDSGAPEVGCDGVFCNPGFDCNPVDGQCLCGGQGCDGDCDADSGTCLVTCIADAGGDPFPILGTSPYAQKLPPATVNSPYIYQFPNPPCGRAPFEWAGHVDPDLGMLLSTGGVLAGLPWTIPDGGWGEIQVWVRDSRGNVGTQDDLIEVLRPDGGGG